MPRNWAIIAWLVAYYIAALFGWLWIEKAFPLPPIKVEEVKP
jgi:hypothetical protein